MHSTNFMKLEILKNLSQIPDNKLEEIKDFVEFILSKSSQPKTKPVKLKGIWKNKGFEKIKNIETQLKDIRQELDDKILKREI